MVGPHAFSLVTIVLVVASLCCAGRLYYLHLIPTYPAVFAFLMLQLATAFASNIADRHSNAYAFIYVALAIFEWIVYGFLIREIYSLTFSDFPGIAFVGRSSIYAATAGTVGMCVITLAWVSEFRNHPGPVLSAVQFLSHLLIFGFAALILLVLYLVSKYPLKLRYNLVYNSTFFSIVLLAEAFGILADLATGRHRTLLVNLIVSAIAATAVAVWPFLLSYEGQKVFRLHPRLSLSDERLLLHQLSSVSDLLLRLVRNK